MAEQETKTAKFAGKKNRYWFNNRGTQTTKTIYKSKVTEPEDEIFDVGASKDPAKFSKLLKSIENYIQKNYKTRDDIVKAIQQLKHPTLAYPKQLTKAQYTDANGDFDDDAFEMVKFAWKEDYKGMKHQMDKYTDNESNAWALIYDQCSPELKNKLEGTSGYDNAKSSNDIIKLLTVIRGYCCQFDTLNDEYMSIVKSLKNLFYYFQKTEQTNSEFHEDFMVLVEVIKEYGGTGSLTHFPNMIKKELSSKNLMEPSKASADELKEAKSIVREKFIAALMLNGANASKYGELKRSMAENYVPRTSEYPESPEVVLRILNAYQPPAGWNMNRCKQEAGARTNEGAMLAQTDNGNWKTNIECYKMWQEGSFLIGVHQEENQGSGANAHNHCQRRRAISRPRREHICAERRHQRRSQS